MADHENGAISPEDQSDPEDTLKSRLKIKDSYFKEDSYKVSEFNIGKSMGMRKKSV
jgi:hypothetical protein